MHHFSLKIPLKYKKIFTILYLSLIYIISEVSKKIYL